MKSGDELRRILVVGYGNPLRMDDGAGTAAAERIRALGIPGVEVRTAHQLVPEMAEDFALYDAVVLVDAAVDGLPVSFFKVKHLRKGGTLSHHCDASLIASLLAGLYRSKTPVYACTIRGESFHLGEDMTLPVKLRICEAVERIHAFIMEVLEYA